jgi:hypothetical protein
MAKRNGKADEPIDFSDFLQLLDEQVRTPEDLKLVGMVVMVLMGVLDQVTGTIDPAKVLAVQQWLVAKHRG